MERIRLEDLPKILNEDIINILAFMANEIPQSKDWHDIFEVLSDVDYRRVMDRRRELQNQEEQSRKAAMTEEEKIEEKNKIDEFIRNLKPTDFFGNMGQPETIEDLKNRYGEYSSDYDDSKIEEKNNSINLIESFPEKTTFDSSSLLYFYESINELTIRVIEGVKQVQYRFYNLIEYYQSSKNNENQGIFEKKSSDWLSKIEYDNSYLIHKLDKQTIKHFVFNISDLSFEILAENYVKDLEFYEVYREQELVRKIIK
ncbi:hypothetical protein [Tenacibaculum sp. M341]|uniref:hypothetical protein n=1 Tax=Tenacibaculum sp. M341 TaxID=2530339 RepID=UPI001047177C|nr:hypothetical protein [Tenacibaculum sp. M341]TCI85013.1 hypothetical protein EYW44_18500 [Tenacibaculum sp. M341]